VKSRRDDMRDTEFRGKRKDTGEWVYGDLVHDIPGNPMIAVIAGTYRGDDFSVVPETVGQYAGHLDRYEKKFFDGDIVKDWFGNIGVVRYSDYFLAWRLHFHKGRPDLVDSKEYGIKAHNWRRGLNE
jgi:hypothetical protein